MFKQIQAQVQKQFDKIEKAGGVFIVDSDPQKIWDTYLNSFSEEKKQHNNCNCCKDFLRKFGRIVGVEDGKLITLWDFTPEDEEYSEAIKNLRKYILSLKIKTIFLNDETNCGTKRNFDGNKAVYWDHFHLEIPRRFVNTDIPKNKGDAITERDLFERALSELTIDATETILQLIAQNSLYKGPEFEGLLQEFLSVQKEYAEIDKRSKLKDLFVWQKSREVSVSTRRIKNSAIGTLITSLSEGKDMERAVKSYEQVTAPANYKRPTALVTPKMVKSAQLKVKELGLEKALDRRLLDSTSLNVNNCLFSHQDSEIKDVFAEISQEQDVQARSLGKVDEISYSDFVDKILPTSDSVEVLLENRLLSNFVSLVGPREDKGKSLFKWNNNYSWSYSGEVTDSIKERVKKAGGKVDGVLRVSLSWSNHDDLDIHLVEPGGYHLYYGNRGTETPSGADLDVDMNAGHGESRAPVENICWEQLPKKNGKYKIYVHNFARRESTNVGFEVELEFNGETYHFSHPKNGTTNKKFDIVEFEYKNGQIKFNQKIKSELATHEKWGLKTNAFQKVNAITYSPNYWKEKIGNKHLFFLIDNCSPDEKIRPFYNEFLSEDLSEHRKVLEIVGSKLKVEETEEPLAGIGFSESQRNHVYVRVQNKFSRILKVTF